MRNDEFVRRMAKRIDDVYAMQRQLKQCGGNYITNCNVMPSQMKKYIEDQKVLYEFVQGRWLTILLKESDFYRVYYYISDADGYSVYYDKKDLVCEIFLTDGKDDERHNDELEMLDSSGLNRYKSYHRWICKDLPKAVNCKKYPEVGISYEWDMSIVNLIGQYFDKYADYIPNITEEGFRYFCNNNKCIKLFDKSTNEWIGVYIFPAKGKVVDWGYMLINPQYRGKGYGKYIKELMLVECKKSNVKKCRAWIHDENVSSIRLHEKIGYQKDGTRKIVFIKKSSA